MATRFGGAALRACAVARLARLRLHRDWRRILRRSWSLRLAVLAGVLEAANVACEFIPRETSHRVLLGGLAAAVSLAAALARIVAQPSLGSE